MLLKTQKEDSKKIKLMSPSSKLAPVPIPNHSQKIHQSYFSLILYYLCEAGILLAEGGGGGGGDESKTN